MKALAYWIYETRNVEDKTIKNYIKWAKEYHSYHTEYDPWLLKILYYDFDEKALSGKENLSKKYRALCLYGRKAFGYTKNDFAKIKFTAEGKSREIGRGAIDRKVIKRIH